MIPCFLGFRAEQVQGDEDEGEKHARQGPEGPKAEEVPAPLEGPEGLEAAEVAPAPRDGPEGPEAAEVVPAQREGPEGPEAAEVVGAGLLSLRPFWFVAWRWHLRSFKPFWSFSWCWHLLSFRPFWSFSWRRRHPRSLRPFVLRRTRQGRRCCRAQNQDTRAAAPPLRCRRLLGVGLACRLTTTGEVGLTQPTWMALLARSQAPQRRLAANPCHVTRLSFFRLSRGQASRSGALTAV